MHRKSYWQQIGALYHDMTLLSNIRYSHIFYGWSHFPWIPKFELVFCIFECCWEFSTSNKLFCVSNPINFKGIACCWKLLNAIYFFFCNIFVRHTRKIFVFILTAIEKPDSYTIMVFTNLIQIPNRMEFFTQCRQFKIQFQDFIYIVCKNDEDEKYSLWHRLTFSFLSPIRQW